MEDLCTVISDLFVEHKLALVMSPIEVETQLL
jgi:hypothetical protein